MLRNHRLTLAALVVTAAGVIFPVASQARTAPASTVAHPAAALKTVTVATGFMPDVIFTPYYVAQDLGYYKAVGLNVVMNYDRLPNLLQSLSDGHFAFAASSGDTTEIAAAAGAKVQYVMGQYTAYPVGAMWLKSGGPTITKPADLKGLNIGISSPGSSTDLGLKALLASAGLTEADVKVTTVGFNETQALISHQIDVAMTFTDNEPVQAAALGYPVNTLKVAPYVNITPNGVVTGDNTIKNDPNLVKHFVQATLKGEAYTLTHTDAAFQIALKRMPELVDPKQVAIQRQVLSARLAYQQPIKGHPLGWSDPKSWTTTANFLKSAGAITTPLPNVNTLFTNSYVNAANVKVGG